MKQRSWTYRPPGREAVMISPTEIIERIRAEMGAKWPFVFDLTGSTAWDEMAAMIDSYTVTKIVGLNGWLNEHCGSDWEEEILFIDIRDPDAVFHFKAQ